jgi:putative acetyltransferase
VSFAIEPERPGDEAAIREILVAAFNRAVEGDIVDALRANGHAIVSLVARAERDATAGGAVVGHVMFSPVVIERDGVIVARGLGLAPLAVAPARQRVGIGSALSRAGLDACRALGQPWCVVLGDPAYYARFGFERARDHAIDNEFGAKNAFMIQALASAELPRGLARYGAEFHT